MASAVQLQLSALLTTTDNYVREQANEWLTSVFQKSEDAWMTSILLITQTAVPADSILTLDNLQLFGAQTLFQKLSDDLEQINDDPAKCLEICRLLTNICLSSRTSSLRKSVRQRLCECLAVAIVSFIGTHWASALQDIHIASRQRLQHGSVGPLDADECLISGNLMHVLAELPELAASIEKKRYLMSCLGHNSYMSWRKTRPGRAILLHATATAQEIAKALKALLPLIQKTKQEQKEDSDLGLAALEALHETFQTATTWARNFDMCILTADTELCNFVLIKSILDVEPFVDDVILSEMFNINVPRLSIVQPNSITLKRSSIKDLSFLGSGREIVEPLLIFLTERILAPVLSMAKGDNLVTLEDLDRKGGGSEFLGFAYRWTCIIYDLAVISPDLLISQNEPIVSSYGTLPDRIIIRLLRAVTSLHPTCHARVLNLWTDIIDMQNDRSISATDVELILQELAQSSLLAIINYCRRDNPVWDANSESSCTEPDGRVEYIEVSQDCIVSLYYLYKAVSDNHASSFVAYLASEFIKYSSNDPATFPQAAACLILIDCIVETVIDFTSVDFVNALISICREVPADEECVALVANLIEKQAVFLTDSKHTALWTTFFECLMKMFDVNMLLCSQGLYELCESGGNLGLEQMEKSTDLIRNFYSFIQEKCSSFDSPHYRFKFESALYGALTSLIRRLPSSEGCLIFTESLNETVKTIEEELNKFEQTKPENDLSLIESLVLQIGRISRAIASLESRAAELSNVSIKALRQEFLSHFLFGSDDSSKNWMVICRAGIVLMNSVGKVTASDCYKSRNCDNKLWPRSITEESLKNIGVHVIRQCIRSTNPADHMAFWTTLSKLLEEAIKIKAEVSVCLCIGDVFNSVRNEDIANSSSIIKLPAFKVAELFETVVVPVMIKETDSIPILEWNRRFKPFFALIETVFVFWISLRCWNESTVLALLPVLIKGATNPSGKLQHYTLGALGEVLSSQSNQVLNAILQNYNDLVGLFWHCCHLWEFQRISRAVSLIEGLVRPTFLDLSPDQFVSISRQVYMTTRNNETKSEGLLHILSNSEMEMILELLKNVRGMRLRQLLMDLIKIGKRAATTDCLLSYQFVLENWSKKSTEQTSNTFVELD